MKLETKQETKSFPPMKNREKKLWFVLRKKDNIKVVYLNGARSYAAPIHNEIPDMTLV